MMGLLQQAEFWILIAFVIAFGFLAWKVTPMLTGALDERGRKIRADLEEAARLRDEAQHALAEYQRRQRDALKEAEEIVAHARAEAERVAQAAERDIAAALERRRRMASEKIALEEAKALEAVRNAAVEVAIAAVRRTLATELAPERRARLLDDAIAAIPHALH